MSKNSKFIGGTIGLQACGHGRNTLVRIEYSRNQDGSVLLSAVSGHNLARMPGAKTISGDYFEDRPHDPYDDTREAQWALELLGYKTVGDN